MPRKTSARRTDARKPVVEALGRLLADSYTLYLKTHNFHWNVTGPMFNTLHSLFQLQYQELALAVDEIAERIRALGYPAPGSYAEFANATVIQEAQGVLEAKAMLGALTEDQGRLVASARRAQSAAEKAGDDGTADLAVRRMQVHEKNAWMLRVHLE